MTCVTGDVGQEAWDMKRGTGGVGRKYETETETRDRRPATGDVRQGT